MWTTADDLAIIEPRIIQLVRELTAAPDTDEVSDALKPVMAQVVDQAAASSQGGKRLRALLTLDAFDALMAQTGSSTPDMRDAMTDLACAIEVFQTAALVHDDIIDESDLRRGKPSAHRALEQAVHSGAIGHGLGLMLGDILATACIEIARRAARRLDNTDAINEAFLTMQREVEIGQVLDLAVELTPLEDPDALVDASLNVFRWKTASYTTIAPLLFALLAAGADPAEAWQQALAVGRPLGLAFQLADDLLDVVGSSRIPANQWAAISEKASARCCWPTHWPQRVRRTGNNLSICLSPTLALMIRWHLSSRCSNQLEPSNVPAIVFTPCGWNPAQQSPISIWNPRPKSI